MKMLSQHIKEKFGCKVYKLSLDGGFSCPNRDGTLGTGGCIFCTGSGEFAEGGTDPIAVQLQRAKTRVRSKNKGGKYIAYFQAYTNTYGPVEYLRQIYTEALSCPDVCGISIATRPDCLPEDVLSLLAELKAAFPHKFIWVELGLQTIHEETASFIRRGYALPCFAEGFAGLKAIGIPVIVHVILGLPHETPEMMLETIAFLNTCKPFGIKLQLLHILENTDLADYYREGNFSELSKEEYLDLVIDCLEHLSPEIVIHRVTGDGPRDLLIAPRWSLDKRGVLNALHKKMKEHKSRQGNKFQA